MAEMSEREKVIEKGKRMLREYLNDMGRDVMSMKNRRQLFSVIETVYRESMKDEAYFEEIQTFVNRRKPAAEKEAFCRKMVVDLVNRGNVRKRYANKYPEEYTMPWC